MSKWVCSQAVGVALLSMACGSGATRDEVGSTSESIIGGATVSSTDPYPGISAFVGYGTPSIADNEFCTAVMIAPGWVATAAHCVHVLSDTPVLARNCRQAVDDPSAPDKCELDFGYPDWRDAYDPARGGVEGESFFHIKKHGIHEHSGFNASTMTNDIALVELESAVPSYMAKPALVLAKKWVDRLTLNAPVVTAGWGISKVSGSVESLMPKESDSLLRMADKMVYRGNATRCLSTDISAYPYTDSRNRTISPTSTDFCAASTTPGDHDLTGSQTTKDGTAAEVTQGPCSGDSGGPLYYDVANAGRTVMGITSRSLGCALLRYPAIYNRIGDYIDEFQRRDGNPFNLSQRIRGIHTPGFWGTLTPTAFGNGTFFQGTTHNNTPVVGDFNGDGYSDVAYYGRCNSDGHACWRVHLNTKTNGFIANDYGADFAFQESAFRGRPMAGDFNSDGYSDIAYAGVCGADSHACWRVLVNDRAGHFNAADYGWGARFIGGSVVGVPIAGDFNGDGYTDIAYAGVCGSDNHSCFRVHINSKTGGFVANDYGGGIAFQGTSYANTPMAGDFDGDGYDDIAYYGLCPENCWRVHRNDQNGTFHAVNWGGSIRTRGSDVTSTPVATDLNGDGNTDIVYSGVCGSSNTPCLRVHLNDRGISFPSAEAHPAPAFYGSDVKSMPLGGDFDGDGSFGFGYLGSCSGSACWQMHQLP